MKREAILEVLRTHKPFLVREMGVKSIALFGSYARGSALPGSDLDLIVEMETADFQHYIMLKTFLEQQFDMPIDLLRKGPHLREQFLKRIEPELVYA